MEGNFPTTENSPSYKQGLKCSSLSYTAENNNKKKYIKKYVDTGKAGWARNPSATFRSQD